MTINIGIPHHQDMRPHITVVGVGGAGGNAVNNMISLKLEGVDFVATNTDAQSLDQSLTERRIQLGATITQGLGAGSRPDVGRAAAEEAMEQILDCLQGSHMVFITAGMGGGTGTGAAPVIARAARERGILTVGVVTKPFHFEGSQRMRLAEAGIAELQQFVDTLIIIPNQNLFRVANEKTTFAEAFKMADNVLHAGVRGITDLMVMPGLINLDFADVRAVMAEMGKAMMGTGEASGERRAIEAAEAAISNPLLDDVSMRGARGLLINVTGGADMTLFEVDEAANRIREEVDPDANIIFGSTYDEATEGRMRVSVVATGIDAEEMAAAHRPGPGSTSFPGIRVLDGGLGQKRQSETVASTAAAVTGAAAAEDQPDTAPAPEAAPAVAALAEVAPYAPPAAERPGFRAAPEARPDPYAAAAMANGGRAEAAPSRPSLIERMTGAGRALRAHADARLHVETRARPLAPEPASLPAQVTESPALAQHEDDLLEIPAFLRRQAN